MVVVVDAGLEALWLSGECEVVVWLCLKMEVKWGLRTNVGGR